MADQIITQEFLHKMYEYRNGVLYKKPQSKRSKSNLIAGTIRKDGYVRLSINNKLYYSHRFIYMMFYGEMPIQIDHIDGNPSNNKIENLRKANNFQNSLNKSITKANTSGYKNVYWHKSASKWSVEIKAYDKKMYFGVFEDLELADLVAQEARAKYHKEWANHS
jgi:hypothetical protein